MKNIKNYYNIKVKFILLGVEGAIHFEDISKIGVSISPLFGKYFMVIFISLKFCDSKKQTYSPNACTFW